METITISGPEYQKISLAFCQTNDGKHYSLDNLNMWSDQLTFSENSVILNQTKAGPCGLYAALQANIICQLILNEGSVEPNEALYSAILSIMEIISGDTYAFCTFLDDTNSKAVFSVTKSKDEALVFLNESGYTLQDRAVLLIAFSFVYLASSLDWFNNLSAPFVYSDQNTSMQFVFLMVSGQIDGESPKNKKIAIKCTHNKIPELNKYWLNEGATVVIFLFGQTHFFAVMKDEENGLIFDTLGNGKIKSIPFNNI